MAVGTYTYYPPAGGGTGTVTSVGMSVPGVLFSVTGSPVTSSGTLALALLTQSANLVLAGPASGAAATPTLRALVANDLPSTLNATTFAGVTSANAFGYQFVNGTKIISTANGTLAFTDSTGAAMSTFQIGPASTSGTLFTQTSTNQLNITSGTGGNINITLSNSLGVSTRIGAPTFFGDASFAGTHGSISFPAATTGVIAFAAATGTLTNAGFSFNAGVQFANIATASAPTGIKGLVYFDTTLNKLRVYTGSAYETITSA